MSSLKQIAAQCRVSVSTVSRALNDSLLISEKVRRRIQKTAGKLEYAPSIHAKVLAGGRSGIIGFLATNLTTEFEQQALKGIEAVTREKGYSVLVCLYYPDEERMASYRQLLAQPFFDGIIVGLSAWSWRGREKIPAKRVVYMDQWPEETRHQVVTSDHAQSARLIAGFFKSHDVGHVVYYGEGNWNTVESLRFSAIRRQCTDEGWRFTHCDVDSAEFGRLVEKCANTGERYGFVDQPNLLYELPDAPALKDFLAKSVAATFDNDPRIMLRRFAHGISVTQDHETMGRLAVETLIDRIEGHQRPHIQQVPVIATSF